MKKPFANRAGASCRVNHYVAPVDGIQDLIWSDPSEFCEAHQTVRMLETQHHRFCVRRDGLVWHREPSSFSMGKNLGFLSLAWPGHVYQPPDTLLASCIELLNAHKFETPLKKPRPGSKF